MGQKLGLRCDSRDQDGVSCTISRTTLVAIDWQIRNYTRDFSLLMAIVGSLSICTLPFILCAIYYTVATSLSNELVVCSISTYRIHQEHLSVRLKC